MPRTREIFLSSRKVGSDAEGLAHDGAIALSLLLQMGMSATELALHLGRQGADAQAPAASFLGLAAHRAAMLRHGRFQSLIEWTGEGVLE